MLLFCLASFLLQAQDLSYSLTYLSAEQGLSDHRTYILIIHSNGFAYVCHRKGIDRFDGYEFVPIELPPREKTVLGSLDYFPSILHELEDERILIIAYGVPLEQGTPIDVYDPKTGKVESIQIEAIDLDNNWVEFKNTPRISFVQADREITEGERYRLEDQKGNILVHQGFNPAIWARLYLNTGEEIDLTEVFQSVERPVANGDDFSKEIYLTSFNGILKIDLNNSPFQPFLNEQIQDWGYQLSVRAIHPLSDNRILVSTEQKDLALINLENKEIDFLPMLDANTGKPLAHGSKNFRSIYQENDSIFWLTNYQKYQLVRWNINTFKTSAFLNEIDGENSLISSIYTKEKTLLIITNGVDDGNQLIEFDPNNREAKKHYFASEAMTQQKNRSTYLLQTKDSTIWIGTTTGLFNFDLNEEKVLSSYHFKESAPERDSSNYPQHYVLNANSILCLYENEKNELLIALEEGGVQFLDLKTGTISDLTKDDGLSDNTVCGILPDKGGYWFSTFNGLSFYDEQRKVFRNFYTKNGLSHNEFNRFAFAQNSNGINFMGGMNGLVSFDPKAVLKSDKPLKLLISEITYFNSKGENQVVQRNNFGDHPKVIIPSNNRNCAIKMALTDFKNAGNHQYDYRLIPKRGFLSKHPIIWKSNGRNRQIRFDYLEAGKYDLVIRGTSSEGVVSEEMVIQLEVQEFFYKTWWFFLLCLSAIGTLIYVFYQSRLAQAIKIERLRTQLSSDLHDDVGSLLSGVAYQMELLEYSVSEKNKSLVQQIATSSRNAMSRMRDVVWAIDSRNTSLQDLVERMKEFAREVTELSELDIVFKVQDIPMKKTVSAEARHALLLIYKEFVSNTIKYAKATRLDVLMNKNGKSLELILRDNGVGMQKKANEVTGQGLANMLMRAEKINAQIQMQSEGGFAIHVLVPVF